MSCVDFVNLVIVILVVASPFAFFEVVVVRRCTFESGTFRKRHICSSVRVIVFFVNLVSPGFSRMIITLNMVSGTVAGLESK